LTDINPDLKELW